MKTLSDLSLTELNQLVSIRAQIEKLQARMNALLGAAPAVAAPRAGTRPGRKARGGLTRVAAVTKVLADAGKPLNVQGILDGLRAMSYPVSGKNPRKALTVLLYGAKTRGRFRKVARGRFTVAAAPTVPAAKPPNARRAAKRKTVKAAKV